ncbi:hypothetical protein J3F84DRAFT_263889 [Trichoderma pleuroticola]
MLRRNHISPCRAALTRRIPSTQPSTWSPHAGSTASTHKRAAEMVFCDRARGDKQQSGRYWMRPSVQCLVALLRANKQWKIRLNARDSERRTSRSRPYVYFPYEGFMGLPAMLWSLFMIQLALLSLSKATRPTNMREQGWGKRHFRNAPIGVRETRSMPNFNRCWIGDSFIERVAATCIYRSHSPSNGCRLAGYDEFPIARQWASDRTVRRMRTPQPIHTCT